MTQEFSTTTVSPKIVILEGCDRTGKGSLQLAINKLTRYKHIVIDRGPVGFKAYCQIFNKEQDLNDKYQTIEESFLKLDNVVMIYLTASDEELQRRCEETDHEFIDYPLHKFFYEKEFDKSRLEKYSFDTTHTAPEVIVQQLVKMGVL